MVTNNYTQGRFGYLRPSAIFNRLLNILLAIVLLLLASPLMLLIYVMILITDSPPGFYVGTRLGLNKKPFKMYKFRTLVQGADAIIGGDLLSSRHELTTPFGQFLRDTRLDELPQLLNVLIGNMDFVGPRPVRPEVYEKVCSQIRNYDKRFRVKPGLLGLSQLVTPHSTPKRMRSLIDNLLIRKKQKLAWDTWFIVYTGFLVLRTTVTETCKVLYERVWQQGVLGKYNEKRRSRRIRPEDAEVHFVNDSGKPVKANLIDINDDAFLMICLNRLIPPYPKVFSLELAVKNGRRKALCRGEIYREMEREYGYTYVVFYDPISALNFYTFHQYFLGKSVAQSD
jgi:lipopolysaccharide/colanic/teichoic acid biosynthesis glycosyltransferase